MGLTAISQVCFGIKIDYSLLCVKTLHPLWGIYKYDPSNGKLVTKFVEKRIYIDEVVEDLNVEYVETGGENSSYVIGKKLTSSRMDHDEQIKEFPLLNDEEIERLKSELQEICDRFGIENNPKYFNVFYYSC